MEKKLLRKIHMEKLARLQTDKMQAADCKIREKILQLNEYKTAKKIFLYISVGKEVNTRPLIQDALKAGKEVYIPICAGGGIMHAARLNRINQLIEGRYGIPTVPADSEKIPPEELDFILVPGVCFDRNGNRLGRGGGYYDRYLDKPVSAALVGLCRAEQLLDELSVNYHDKKVDIVISENEVLRIK